MHKLKAAFEILSDAFLVMCLSAIIFSQSPYSTCEYNPSVFSLTITKSISSRMQFTPLYDFMGLMFAYTLSAFLKLIIGLGWPGVDVDAPNNTASLLLAIFIVSSGNVVPVLLKHSKPAIPYSKLNSKSILSSKYSQESITSFPIPSPPITAILYIILPLTQFVRILIILVSFYLIVV